MDITKEQLCQTYLGPMLTSFLTANLKKYQLYVIINITKLRSFSGKLWNEHKECIKWKNKRIPRTLPLQRSSWNQTSKMKMKMLGLLINRNIFNLHFIFEFFNDIFDHWWADSLLFKCNEWNENYYYFRNNTKELENVLT